MNNGTEIKYNKEQANYGIEELKKCQKELYEADVLFYKGIMSLASAKGIDLILREDAGINLYTPEKIVIECREEISHLVEDISGKIALVESLNNEPKEGSGKIEYRKAEDGTNEQLKPIKLGSGEYKPAVQNPGLEVQPKYGAICPPGEGPIVQPDYGVPTPPGLEIQPKYGAICPPGGPIVQPDYGVPTPPGLEIQPKYGAICPPGGPIVQPDYGVPTPPGLEIQPKYGAICPPGENIIQPVYGVPTPNPGLEIQPKYGAICPPGGPIVQPDYGVLTPVYEIQPKYGAPCVEPIQPIYEPAYPTTPEPVQTVYEPAYSTTPEITQTVTTPQLHMTNEYESIPNTGIPNTITPGVLETNYVSKHPKLIGGVAATMGLFGIPTILSDDFDEEEEKKYNEKKNQD